MIPVESGRQLAEHLAGVRQASGRTQQGFATIMGTSQSYISKLENYDIEPQVSNVIRWVKANGYRLMLVPVDEC
jgi:predicted transcriptional regulator